MLMNYNYDCLWNLFPGYDGAFLDIEESIPDDATAGRIVPPRITFTRARCRQHSLLIVCQPAAGMALLVCKLKKALNRTLPYSVVRYVPMPPPSPALIICVFKARSLPLLIGDVVNDADRGLQPERWRWAWRCKTRQIYQLTARCDWPKLTVQRNVCSVGYREELSRLIASTRSC